PDLPGALGMPAEYTERYLHPASVFHPTRVSPVSKKGRRYPSLQITSYTPVSGLPRMGPIIQPPHRKTPNRDPVYQACLCSRYTFSLLVLLILALALHLPFLGYSRYRPPKG